MSSFNSDFLQMKESLRTEVEHFGRLLVDLNKFETVVDEQVDEKVALQLLAAQCQDFACGFQSLGETVCYSSRVILLRGLTEAVLRLVWIANEGMPAYESLLLKDLCDRHERYEEARKQFPELELPKGGTISMSPEYRMVMSLTDKGVKKKGVSSLFKSAGEPQAYVQYKDWSSIAHSELLALRMRLIDSSDSKKLLLHSHQVTCEELQEMYELTRHLLFKARECLERRLLNGISND
jgi:hypothetical protein